MSGLESSVTLEDVFHVVEARRVPLAPELAGYLTLEIADGADAGAGNVDPKAVFVSEEGSVALVRPKIAPPKGDCEASIRAILTKLLEASGSKTPALAAAAQRKPGNGLPALVEELEAALIPVNRAAGRRALARLARETKRVLQGIGRNATGASGQYSSVRPQKSTDEDMLTAKRANLAELAAQITAAAPSEPPPARPSPPPMKASPAVPAAPALPKPPSNAPPTPPPPPQRATGTPEKPKLFEGDEVDSLLSSFGVSGSGEKQMSRDLKAIAGLDPTPGAPNARSFGAAISDATGEPPTLQKKEAPKQREAPKVQKKSGAPDGIEALLALADASGPLAPPLHNPQPQPPQRPAAKIADELQPPTAAAAFPSPAQAQHVVPPPYQTPGPPPAYSAPMPAPAPPPVAPMAAPMPNFAPIPPPEAEVRRPLPPAQTQVSPKRERKDSSERRRQPTAVTRRKGQSTGLVMSILALVALVAGTAAVWRFAPQVFTGKKRTQPQPSVTVAPPPAPRCKVALVLTDVPANAEILLRMGQAPVDVERMPVGTRLELVGTAEGYAPRRAVVRAEAVWDKGPDGKPRVEVPIQLDPSKAKPGAVDPWPAAEPGSQVGGSGPPGTVHVVSNVRGADVWLLAGLGPEARIEQLRCDGDIDVLLAGPPTLRKRIRVPEKDIEAVQADAQGNKVVNVSAR